MATSGIQRPKDIVVTSVELGNRMIIDRDGFVNVPRLFADDKLTVDVGGSVDFRATTIDLRNSTIDTSGASIVGDISFAKNAIIAGNLTVQGKTELQDDLLVIGKTELQSDTDITGNAFVGGDLTVLGHIMVDQVIAGNLIGGNLSLDNLFVHAIYGHSPINFRSDANFFSPSNFRQLVQMLGADLSCQLGSAVRVVDGGDVTVTGGNVRVTPTPAIAGGGQVQVMDGGDVMVAGGNITVTDHDITGKGSISVLNGGDINLRNGGSVIVNDGGNVTVNQGGNIVIADFGKLVLMGGQVVYNNGGVESTINFPIIESQGGTGQTNYLTGDILYSTANDFLGRLPIGLTDNVLTVVGGIPTWSNTVAPANGGTGQTTYANNDMLYATGANSMTRLPIGVDGDNLCIGDIYSGANQGKPIWKSSLPKTMSTNYFKFVATITPGVTPTTVKLCDLPSDTNFLFPGGFANLAFYFRTQVTVTGYTSQIFGAAQAPTCCWALDVLIYRDNRDNSNNIINTLLDQRSYQGPGFSSGFNIDTSIPGRPFLTGSFDLIGTTLTFSTRVIQTEDLTNGLVSGAYLYEGPYG